jgi:putative hemolysin
MPSLLLFAFLVLLVAFLAAAETSFTLLDKQRLRLLRQTGDRRAGAILYLWDHPERFFTPLLAGSTLTTVSASVVLTAWCIDLWGPAGPWLATALATILLFFFAELLPKGLASRFPRHVSSFLLPLVYACFILFWPVSTILNLLLRGLRRLFPSLEGQDGIRSRKEIEALAQAWGREGDRVMLSRTFRFAGKNLGEVMVPRVAMRTYPADRPALEILRETASLRYSRFPLYQGSIDRIVGILHLKDLLGVSLTAETPARTYARLPLFLPEPLGLVPALEEMRLKHTSVAIVVDEQGGTAGLLSMEDLAEEIVGEIWDEYDAPPEGETRRSDGNLLLYGWTTLEDLSERYGLLIDSEAITLGGALAERLGHVPRTGEDVDLGPTWATVLEASPTRVERVLLRPKER